MIHLLPKSTSLRIHTRTTKNLKNEPGTSSTTQPLLHLNQGPAASSQGPAASADSGGENSEKSDEYSARSQDSGRTVLYPDPYNLTKRK